MLRYSIYLNKTFGNLFLLHIYLNLTLNIKDKLIYIILPKLHIKFIYEEIPLLELLKS